MLPSCLRSCRYNLGHFTLFIELMYSIAAGAGASQVIVPKKVNAVLGKNVTLNCRVEVATNLTLTQSSWERQLPSGSVTVAVYNPMFGISIPPEYAHRLSFCSPSSHDAAIVLEDVGFADNGMYTCKVATFPLGNTQASTVVSVLVEPKVYVSAGTVALIDGGNETTVATCIAERARPPAEVSWESNVFGQSVVQIFDEANSTTSTQVRYLWQPTRHVQAHPLTCVVRHPALANDFRIPYELNVQFAPDISVVGYDGDWYLGRENVQLTCRATASPPANHFRWIRLDGDMPWGVETVNNTLLFLRPLQRNDSGVYRCEVANDINLRSRDLRILIQDPPTTSMPSTTPSPVLTGTAAASSSSLDDKRQVLFTSPTLAALPDSYLGSIVGGAVGGALFLLLLLALGGVLYLRKQQTFRSNYYTKQCMGPSDMQKVPVQQQHELHTTQSVDNTYLLDRDREEWGDCQLHQQRDHANHIPSSRNREHTPNGHTRAIRESRHTNNHHTVPHNNHQYNIHQQDYVCYESPKHTDHSSARYIPQAGPLTNGEPDECFDCDGDYVSHLDGSVMSRREWYV